MKRAVKIMAVVTVVLALAIIAVLLFDNEARDRLVRLFGGGPGDDTTLVADTGGANALSDSGGTSGSAGAAKPGKAADVARFDRAAIQAMLKAGRIDEAEVERRVAEIEATKKRTIEVKRAEEQRRMDEVADWFAHLVEQRPESGAKAREILNEYIELRYATYGDMEDVDPEFARAQRESIRQRLGQRLMSELPPAEGATVMKQLFI